MLQTLKSVLKDAMWLSIGTVATLGYVSYKAGKRVVDDVPEMMDFAKDTYGQVKDVLSKDAECTEPLHGHHDGCPECDIDYDKMKDDLKGSTYERIVNSVPWFRS
tara:strand:- start:1080 stop:1394 length:315 start_codon:yes stop_codon:yes gene_type:complete